MGCFYKLIRNVYGLFQNTLFAFDCDVPGVAPPGFPKADGIAFPSPELLYVSI